MSDGSPRFTRVNPAAIAKIERQVDDFMAALVHALPSAGRTIT